jgi:hypothetical protein
MIGSLELWGTVLSFVGGAVLSWDVLTVKKVKTGIGARHLQKIFQEIELGDQLTDDKGQPLRDEESLELWHAKRSLTWMRAGFLLMTLGFLLQILSLLVKPSGSPST